MKVRDICEKLQCNFSELSENLGLKKAACSNWNHRHNGIIPKKYHAKIKKLLKESNVTLDSKQASKQVTFKHVLLDTDDAHNYKLYILETDDKGMITKLLGSQL